MYSVLKPCRTKAAFEGTPRKRLSLDLSRLASALLEMGHRLEADAGLMVAMVDPKGVGYSVYRSGRVLVKTQDRTDAERILKEISDVVDRIRSTGNGNGDDGSPGQIRTAVAGYLRRTPKAGMLGHYTTGLFLINFFKF